jgi:uncharacterized protein (DUF2235 family)
MGGYRFLMQNWTPNSKISIFGFSRGAYTARALAGMLHRVGLLARSNDEQVPFAYHMYAKESSEACAGFKRAFCNAVEVDFLGVWETVSSVGLLTARDLPFTDSAQFIRVFRVSNIMIRVISHLYIGPDEQAQHAVSLDERRCKFKANLCELVCEGCEQIRRHRGTMTPVSPPTDGPPECGKAHTDVEEVWFAGGHEGAHDLRSDSRVGLPCSG